MDDLIHRRNSYPQIENLQNSSVYDPSAIDLPEITRGNSDRLVPRITFDHSDRGVDPKNSEPIRYSTSDFNKDLDDIQRAHGAEHQTSALPDARQERSLGDESYHGLDPTSLQSPLAIEGIATTHIDPSSPSTTSIELRDPSSRRALPANRHAPPFPLPPLGDATKRGAQKDPEATLHLTQGQSTATKIRNPRRRRRFMRWVKKRFTTPWSEVCRHDPNDGKNAAKLAINQGFFRN